MLRSCLRPASAGSSDSRSETGRSVAASPSTAVQTDSPARISRSLESACRNPGRATTRGGRKRVCPKMWNSRQNHRSRRWTCEVNLPRGVVIIIDAGHGVETNFRNELSALKLKYVAGVKTTTSVWASDTLTSENSSRGRGRARMPGGTESTPISVETLALALPKSNWKTIRWRQGTNEILSSRFARLRVRPAHHRRDAASSEEWLLIEWPPNEERPTKFWLSTLRASITFAHLVSTAKLPPYALPLMASCWPKGPLFPPQQRFPPGSSKNLPFPTITGRGALPIRTERHVPDSIATLRREIAVRLAAELDRCPCCTKRRSTRK
jgi:hypothetical protein